MLFQRIDYKHKIVKEKRSEYKYMIMKEKASEYKCKIMKEKGLYEWQYYKMLIMGVPGMQYRFENSSNSYRNYKDMYDSTLVSDVSDEIAAHIRKFIDRCPASAWKISTSYEEKAMYAKYRMEDGSVHIVQDGNPKYSIRKDGSQRYVNLKYHYWIEGGYEDACCSSDVIIFQDGFVKGVPDTFLENAWSCHCFLEDRLRNYNYHKDMNHTYYYL